MANHLLHRCILGVLSHTTRLLCTHRTEYLERADVVLLMEAGHLVRTGNVAKETLALGGCGMTGGVSERILPPFHRASLRKQENELGWGAGRGHVWQCARALRT